MIPKPEKYGWEYIFFTPYQKGWPSKTSAIKSARQSLRNFLSCNKVTTKLNVVSSKIIVVMPEGRSKDDPLGIRGRVYVIIESNKVISESEH